MQTAMDRHFFSLELGRELQRRDGTAFQQLFTDIMKRRHRSDFHTVCPWGSQGDWKNDGYLMPERRMFQCYAPAEFKQAKATKKIRDDFTGAMKHWKAHIGAWVLVHNKLGGLPPFASKALLDLGRKHAAVQIAPWGQEELERIVHDLPRIDAVQVFGPPPTDEAFFTLEFDDIMPIMHQVAAHEPPKDSKILPVPRNKIEQNRLSESAAAFLRQGMIKAPFVEQCFAQDRDTELGDRAAKAFSDRYKTLKAKRLSAEQIFDGLRDFAGGGARLTSSQHAAVFAVLAYFFERCDIFERPRVLPPAVA
jgi:hypothetical protein